MDDAELSSALNQRRLGLEHGRKGLIEIGWNLAEVLLVGSRRQSQRGADLADIGQRRDDVRARRQQLRLPPVVHLSGDIVRHHQFGGPIEVKLSQHQLGFGLVDASNPGAQQGHLVVDGLHGVLQRPAPAHGLRFDAAHFGFGDLQVRRRRIDSRLFDGDCDLKRFLVEFDQQVSLTYPVVVVDEDARDLAPDAGGDECHVTVHIGVVGRNRVERRLDPGNAEPKGGRENHQAHCSEEHPAAPGGLRLVWQDCLGAGSALRGWPRIGLVRRGRLGARFARLAPWLAHGGFLSPDLTSHAAVKLATSGTLRLGQLGACGER